MTFVPRVLGDTGPQSWVTLIGLGTGPVSCGATKQPREEAQEPAAFAPRLLNCDSIKQNVNFLSKCLLRQI